MFDLTAGTELHSWARAPLDDEGDTEDDGPYDDDDDAVDADGPKLFGYCLADGEPRLALLWPHAVEPRARRRRSTASPRSATRSSRQLVAVRGKRVELLDGTRVATLAVRAIASAPGPDGLVIVQADRRARVIALPSRTG